MSVRLNGQLGLARGMKDEYVVCHTQQHVREEIPYDGRRNRQYSNNGRTSQHHLYRCVVCTMLIYEVWNPATGDKLNTTQYVPPKGYSLEGQGRILKKVYRHEWASRWDPPKPTAVPGKPKVKPAKKAAVRRRAA